MRNSRRVKVVSAVLGAALVGGGAWAATLWTVGVSAGSSGEGQSATISNLTFSAVAAPSVQTSSSRVVVTITNPNPYPVTITAIQLPTSSTFATGYTTSGLSTTQTGCLAATPSGVAWNFANGTSGTTHTLSTPITVAATGQTGNPLTVTFTNDASMASNTPLACANTFFSLPSLTGIIATGGAATATVSPATDAWIS
jgi:hypothetical protein